jgi:hypothetical protein
MSENPKPNAITALMDRVPKKAVLGTVAIICLARKPVTLDIAVCITIIAVVGTLAQGWIDFKSLNSANEKGNE